MNLKKLLPLRIEFYETIFDQSCPSIFFGETESQFRSIAFKEIYRKAKRRLQTTVFVRAIQSFLKSNRVCIKGSIRILIAF